MKKFAIGARVSVKFEGSYYKGVIVGRVALRKSGTKAVKAKSTRYAIDFDDGESLIIKANRVKTVQKGKKKKVRRLTRIGGRVARPYFPTSGREVRGRVVDVAELKESAVDTRIPVFDPNTVVIHSGEKA